MSSSSPEKSRLVFGYSEAISAQAARSASLALTVSITKGSRSALTVIERLKLWCRMTPRPVRERVIRLTNLKWLSDRCQ